MDVLASHGVLQLSKILTKMRSDENRIACSTPEPS